MGQETVPNSQVHQLVYRPGQGWLGGEEEEKGQFWSVVSEEGLPGPDRDF